MDAKNAAFFPHMKAFAEGITCLQWVLGTSPKAAIDGAFEAADFYLIKILTAAKNMSGDEQKNHRSYVALFKAMLTNLSAFAVANHKAGVDWNGKVRTKPLTLRLPSAALICSDLMYSDRALSCPVLHLTDDRVLRCRHTKDLLRLVRPRRRLQWTFRPLRPTYRLLRRAVLQWVV